MNSEVSALLAVELLFGNAEKGWAIAANKKNLMPIPEFIKTIKGLNSNLESIEALGK